MPCLVEGVPSQIGQTPNRSWALLLLALALLSLVFLTPLRDTDFWWHLATGRWIVENGSIPKTDPFSFSRHGAPWPNVTWVGDLILYGTYALGGFAALSWLKVGWAIALLLLLALGHRVARVSPSASFATLLLLTFLVQPRWTMARPASLQGPLLAATFLVCLLELKTHHSRRLRPSWLLPLLSLAWLQVHGSALLALVCSATLALSVLVPSPGKPISFRGPARWIPAVASLTCVLTTFATSRGQQVLEHAIACNSSSLAVRLTLEWRRLDPAIPATWLPLAFMAAGLAGALWALSPRKGSVSRQLAVLAFGLALTGAVLGTRFIRHIPTGVVFSSLGVALLFHRLQLTLTALSSERGYWAIIAGLPPALIGAALLLGYPFHPSFRAGVDETRYAPDTVQVLRTLPEGRAMAGMSRGGYLIWQGVPVFIDGRTLLVYDDEFLRQEIIPWLASPAGLDSIANRHDVRYGIVGGQAVDSRVMMAHPDWLPIYFGKTSTLMVRRKYTATLEQLTSPFDLRPYEELRYLPAREWLEPYYAELLKDPRRKMALGRELVRALATQPAPGARVVLRLLNKHDPRFVHDVKLAFRTSVQGRAPAP